MYPETKWPPPSFGGLTFKNVIRALGISKISIYVVYSTKKYMYLSCRYTWLTTKIRYLNRNFSSKHSQKRAIFPEVGAINPIQSGIRFLDARKRQEHQPDTFGGDKNSTKNLPKNEKPLLVWSKTKIFKQPQLPTTKKWCQILSNRFGRLPSSGWNPFTPRGAAWIWRS